MKSTLPATFPIETAFDAGAQLGECVLWCDRSESLFWTDIEACTLHRWHPDSGEKRQWDLPERLGSFALCETPGRLLLGLASGVALFDLERSALGPLVPVEADLSTTRINDGRCDRQGRFVFGTFNRARDGAAIGGFYRVTPGLAIERLPLPPVTVANGLAFSPDGGRLYFADSPTREIRWAAYDAGGGVGPWQPFTRFAPQDGYPDGAATDSEGGLWSTHWDGGCIVRYGMDGRESCRIALPVRRPTCPAFGGAGLGELLISTARIGIGPEQLASEPAAGAILRVKAGYRGLPEPRFAA